jgi:hypothetical protein
VVNIVPVTFAEFGLLSAAKLVFVLSVIFAHVNVDVLNERLAVAFFVMLMPNVTVFANAGPAAAINNAAAAIIDRIPCE